MDRPTCSQQSLDAGEPLFGSAPANIERWLLLEHDGQWDRKPINTPTIPDAVRAHLSAWLERTPKVRFQLVRDERADPLGFPRRLFLVSTRPEALRIREVTFRSWDDVTSLDLDRAADGDLDDQPDVIERSGPLVLVCTHGRRDPCCARAGVPVFRTLIKDGTRELAGSVLQTTHLGGHRFAATLVLLPHGYSYGRLDVAAARRVVRGYASGRLTDLDRLRGRSSYPSDVQAAEYWVRHNAGHYALEGLHLRRRDATGGKFEVTFWDGLTDELHELTVVVETTSDVASTSCGDPPKPILRHRIESYRQVQGATRDFARPVG